jgi:hypothetical protein
MDHTLITNDVIKEDVSSGRNRYGYTPKGGWVWNERARRLSNKGRRYAIVNTESYAF